MLKLIDMVFPARKVGAARVVPATLVSDGGPWLDRLFGASRLEGLPVVTEVTALQIAAVAACVVCYQKSFVLMPWHTYRRLADGGHEHAREHPVYGLLHRRPNLECSPSEFKKFAVCNLKLWGNAYAEIERDRRGRPIALWPIHPSRVHVRRDDAGAIQYDVYGVTGAMQITIPARDMFHVKGLPAPDGLVGLSTIGVARQSLGLTVASEEFGAAYFANGTTPSGVLERPLDAPKMDVQGIQALRSSWMQHHAGAQRFAPAVLQEGTKWTQTTIPNEDAQFLETRTFQVLEVCRWFDVPPHKIFELSKATFSNIEHQQIQWYTDSVAPDTVVFNEEANLKLFTLEEAAAYFTEFDSRGLLRGDHKSRAEYFEIMQRIGVLSINEVRRLENLNPIGDEGDQRFVQTSYQTLGKFLSAEAESASDTSDSSRSSATAAVVHYPESSGTDARTGACTGTPDIEAVKAACMPVFVDALGRVARKRIKATQRAAAKYGGDPEAWTAWQAAFNAELIADQVAALTPAVEAFCRLAGGGVDQVDALCDQLVPAGMLGVYAPEALDEAWATDLLGAAVPAAARGALDVLGALVGELVDERDESRG